MDKRKKRTSYQQYVIYLKMLEDDQIFRTGIIPRDVELNYLTHKWEELAAKLNDCTHGPVLSADEWKKRLNDWKNSTRAKFRKCQAEQFKQSDRAELALTPLEERALLLWGPLSSKSLSNASNEQSTTYILPDQPEIKTDIISIKTDNATNEIIIEPAQIQSQTIPLPALTPLPQEPQQNQNITISPSPAPSQELVENEEEEIKTKRRRHDSEDDQTFGMLKMKPSISTNDIKSLAIELRRLADVKEEKLKFEIAKFKFRNPGFEYNYPSSTSNYNSNDISCNDNAIPPY